jgi:membrane-associated protease RseP (regulator of RpoE activity)
LLRKEGVAVSLPYFIPVPPPFFLGTFGAIIRIKSPIEDKGSLVKVGSIGPILGFFLAIPITVIGLKLSPTSPSPPSSGLFLGNSFIFWILTETVIKVPDSYSVSLHPIAFAGWVGFFITAINLLPVGQLDGGHISYGLFGRKAKVVGIGVVVLMVCLATLWLGWLVWASLALGVIGIKHPPPINDIKKIGKKEKILGGLGFLILGLCFTPMPFKIC